MPRSPLLTGRKTLPSIIFAAASQGSCLPLSVEGSGLFKSSFACSLTSQFLALTPSCVTPFVRSIAEVVSNPTLFKSVCDWADFLFHKHAIHKNAVPQSMLTG